MLRFMYRLLVFLVCALPMQANAGLYKWVDEAGNVNYSDRPVEQAEDLSIPGLVSPASTENAETDPVTEDATTEQVEQSPGSYRLFKILVPEENQTFRSDQGEVSISLLLEPTLDAGHQFQLTLDGNPIQGRFTSTQLLIRQVTRGTHGLQVSIVDSEGTTVASSNSVNFHMRRASARPKFEQQ